MKNLNFTKMFLTRNMLSGTLPPWLPHKIEDKADLSYNDFEIPIDGPKKGEGKLNISLPTRNSVRELKDKCGGNPKYDSIYINCGGGDTVIDGKVFEADDSTSNYYIAPKENWAYSCSGDFGSENNGSSHYIKNGICGSAETQLYNSSRLCPLSLTYYGFCLFKGNYTVTLYFAETVYQSDEDYSNLGKRVFDVYIQGQRELKDFNIKEMANSTSKTWTESFTAYVGDDHLLNIHFFWAGKGSFQVPGLSYLSTAALSLNGPLVSGISVTANFKVGTGLSPSQIAGITAGSVFAPLLLLAFMWKMGWLRKSEMDDINIEAQGKSFTLKQINNLISIILISRGLRYLHEEKRFKIVHGNIKPSNIMLDNSLTAKLSDFGLATLCDEEDPFMTIKAKGSRVYMAPEYSMGKAITVKADVYSFGVVLLEIVSRKVSANSTAGRTPYSHHKLYKIYRSNETV
ncbi:PREDICTED: probable LRR receptor-like serine/threonine-protein kinase RFK1 [Populus euphratica]|uniref:non-specific serine/threonine protein kinase n=1 Tax=Populus euphratica TaxID=75702 RepID=A0AAJ6TI87_POPEU|nr:PREDICTED: probable LRR receptor-like serine/threonine-protein kinase RFK1 [Populus euphratica]